jgi:3-methyladenine DNA glycosylase AlkD
MIIQKIKKELSNNIDSKYQKDVKKYFKEGINLLGVRTPYVRQVSNIYFKQVKTQSKQEILDLCEQMLDQQYNEFSTIAFDWAFKLKKQFEVSDFDRFEIWIEKYVHNWGRCDDFCTHTIHYFIENFPEVIPRIKAWAYSKNMWFRRASAVSFITSKNSWFIAKHTLQDVFDIALILLKDKEDLVQKGYGWMLKSASAFDQKAVFDFVMKHKRDMPRTALRYAIEYMPKDLKKKAMIKD